MLNPSTPLPEQDDELREQVADALRTGYHEIAETKVINRVMQLITADRKRVALEASINEVNQLYNEHLRRWDDDECDIYKNRIAELKTQQEDK